MCLPQDLLRTQWVKVHSMCLTHMCPHWTVIHSPHGVCPRLGPQEQVLRGGCPQEFVRRCSQKADRAGVWGVRLRDEATQGDGIRLRPPWFGDNGHSPARSQPGAGELTMRHKGGETSMPRHLHSSRQPASCRLRTAFPARESEVTCGAHTKVKMFKVAREEADGDGPGGWAGSPPKRT